MSGDDQKAGRLTRGIRLSASVPTSRPFVLRCNKSSVVVSFSTSSSLALENRCCIDRLKPQPIADSQYKQKRLPKEPFLIIFFTAMISFVWLFQPNQEDRSQITKPQQVQGLPYLHQPKHWSDSYSLGCSHQVQYQHMIQPGQVDSDR